MLRSVQPLGYSPCGRLFPVSYSPLFPVILPVPSCPSCPKPPCNPHSSSTNGEKLLKNGMKREHKRCETGMINIINFMTLISETGRNPALNPAQRALLHKENRDHSAHRCVSLITLRCVACPYTPRCVACPYTLRWCICRGLHTLGGVYAGCYIP